MPLAYIRPAGESGLYHVHMLDAHDPGFGVGRPDRPDQGLPGGGYISNRPPGSGGGGYPSHGLPGMPGDTLPAHPPGMIAPGSTLVMVRDAQGTWYFAELAPGSPPPRPLPGPPDHIGGRPPGQGLPPHPSGQPIPGQPPLPGQGLPPTAQPR